MGVRRIPAAESAALRRLVFLHARATLQSPTDHGLVGIESTQPAFTLSGTISGGGQQVNNVIIGAVTPLAGTFTTLAASGAVTATANTASTSKTTGTVVVTGGVGVSGALYADQITVLTAGGGPRVTLQGPNPGVFWKEDGVTADNTLWDLGVNAEQLVGRVVDDAEGAAANWIVVDRAGAAVDSLTFPNGGIVVGAPTGGNKGTGAINAVAVYDDNVLLTDYVLDGYFAGAIDLPDYDSVVPDRIIPAVIGMTGEVITPESRVKRQHDPARAFAAVMPDRFDITKLRAYLQLHRHLPALPSRRDVVATGQPPVGSIVQSVTETLELAFVHILKLEARIRTLETGPG